MGYAVQWLRSLVFIGQMYVSMLVLAIIFVPFAIFTRRAAFKAVRVYTSWVLWTLPLMTGLKVEVRGTPPQDEALIAAKHQSFLDILMIANSVPRPRFIMKSILKWAPIVGWFGLRIGCVPVDRGKKGKAIEQMREGVKNNPAGPGQLIIYPQGTRVAPGVERPYKVGPAVLYQQLGQTCYPVATNVGVFWPRHGIYRKPGLAVVEFLEPIAPGLDQAAFMEKIEQVIEEASDALLEEAGFNKKGA